MSEKNKKPIQKLQNQIASKPLSKEEILNKLFRETEAPIEKQKSDAYLDAINEIRKALSLEEFSIEDKYVAKERNEYKVRFTKDFYIELYRFIGITVTSENEKELLKNKPRLFARKTLEVVYNRFPKGTVNMIRRRNIKINGVYLFKHHEFLTPLGLQELKNYIEQAVKLMEQSSYWYQFIRKLSKLNNRPYQLDIFDTE